MMLCRTSPARLKDVGVVWDSRNGLAKVYVGVFRMR